MNIPTNGESTEKFVSQAFTLSDGGKTTVLDFFSVKFQGVFREFKTFLYKSSKLANTTTFFAKNFLGVGCTNDDLIRCVD